MKVSNSSWAERLAGKMPEYLAREIDIFETEIALRKQGKIDERLFAETRLRRGIYGQRYDNGQRHNGKTVQQLDFPSGELTKGPNTMWDAPGMQRIKIPAGGLNAKQLETFADLAEEYSDGIAHVTTRQDFQLHYVHIDDTPSVMRRLAAANITTREACGNSVRNVTACPYAGVCPDEKFDVTPYSRALSKFLMGHPDTQNFGRKFKPSFSGCSQHACGLASMHDMGMVAVRTIENGIEKRGFEVYVGGGLGAVPYQAKLFDSFVPAEELLPLAQAIARVFARLGEKKNRSRARIKFLVQDLGIEKFRELVLEERKTLPHDSRWTELIEDAEKFQEAPLRPGGKAPLAGFGVFPALGENQHPAAKAGWLHGRNNRASAGRYHLQPTALACGHRAPFYQGNHPVDGRAKYRSSLGQPKRSIGIAPGPRSRGPCRSWRGQHRGHRRVPGDGHLQIGHFLFAWPGRGVAQTAPREKFPVGRLRREAAHQNQRLLQ